MSAYRKDIAAKEVDRHAERILAVSHAIHAAPELAFAEHRASELVAAELESAGCSVRRGVADLPTAVSASIGTGPLVLALFAEYDALPEIGHACGHNIIAAAAVGAALALAPMVDELGITLTVFGTPAEEHGAGKVLMLDRGAFDGVHAALMVHPGPFDSPAPQTAAMSRFDIRARGRASHAGATPFLGINAADALVLAQTAIGLLRQHLRPGDQVHGIVTSAGSAANVVPEYASADYVLRAPTARRLDALEQRVRACFAAGALGTGASIDMKAVQPQLCELFTDAAILEIWTDNHAALGHRVEAGPPVPISTDLGNVSARIPCIHPIIGIRSWPAVNHQPGFADAAVSAAADSALLDAATALAWTVIGIATDAAQRARLLAHPTAIRSGEPR